MYPSRTSPHCHGGSDRGAAQLQKAEPTYGVGVNPISRLIQIQQAKRAREPAYSLMGETGMQKQRQFTMKVLSVCLPVCLSVCLSTSAERLSVHRTVYLSVHRSVHPSVRLSACLPLNPRSPHSVHSPPQVVVDDESASVHRSAPPLR